MVKSLCITASLTMVGLSFFVSFSAPTCSADEAWQSRLVSICLQTGFPVPPFSQTAILKVTGKQTSQAIVQEAVPVHRTLGLAFFN